MITHTRTALQRRRESMKFQEEIRVVREQLKLTEVRLHHVPRWFNRILVGVKKQDPRSLSARLYDGLKVGSNGGFVWMDHWGSTILFDKSTPAFVSEPYGITAIWLQEIETIAHETGLCCAVQPTSWWSPMHTLRIAFWLHVEERNHAEE